MLDGVQEIWNFFPITLFVWTPIRSLLNLIFFPIYFLFLIAQILWNILPELIVLAVITIAVFLLNILAVVFTWWFSILFIIPEDIVGVLVELMLVTPPSFITFWTSIVLIIYFETEFF